jgi:primosomal protein N' (replication factor Y)
MDRDTVRARGAHEDILRRFDSGEIDILVGTQMIAKGHDFPRVTLVGVLAADHALGLPDFRAGERAFQLLTQVAGRAGRGALEGQVIAQAFDPNHPVLLHAAKQDYEAFYESEIRYRRALRYPPLAALIQIIVAEAREGQAWRIADDVAAALAASSDKLTITGPGPAPIERLRSLYRMQILVRSAGRRRLVEAVSAALLPFEATASRRAIHVDVDPVSLM